MLKGPGETLKSRLIAAIDSFGLNSDAFGRPGLIEEASKKAEKLFEDIAKATPAPVDSYKSVLRFMRGEQLSASQYRSITTALNLPVREVRNTTLLEHSRFPELLDWYQSKCEKNALWWLDWFGLLCSYFEFNINTASTARRNGWLALRAFLQQTWPTIMLQFLKGPVPRWARILQDEPALLTEKAADSYGADFLIGDTGSFAHLERDLGVPPYSWFHQAIVLGAVRAAVDRSDDFFGKHIPRFVALMDQYPAFRDEAIVLILNRCYRSADRSDIPQLRDYVSRADVWRNPKLKPTGVAPAWNRVSEPVWRMVLGWVNEGNLKAFFDILRIKEIGDQGRLAFWSQYMKQISWTKLVFGSNTWCAAEWNPGIRDLIAREEGSYARLTGPKDLDAFMMQIGDHIAIEFTQTSNAAYVYGLKTLPFNQGAGRYTGSSADLKAGHVTGLGLRILHNPGWEASAKAELARLGIYPDPQSSDKVTPTASHAPNVERGLPTENPPEALHAHPPPSSNEVRAHGPARQSREARQPTPPKPSEQGRPAGAPFTMTELHALISRFSGAYPDDRRQAHGMGGRLWVENPQKHYLLDRKLFSWGFKWSERRQAWYFLEK